MVAYEEKHEPPHEREFTSSRFPNENTSQPRAIYGGARHQPTVASGGSKPPHQPSVAAGAPPPVPKRPATTTPSRSTMPVASTGTSTLIRSPRQEASTKTTSIISPKLASLTHRVRPVSGKRYFVQNVGRGRWLNVAYGYTHEGASIIAWPKDPSHGDNEIWLFTERTGLFTLRTRCAMFKSDGGYMSLRDSKGVVSQTPTFWKIEEVADKAYKFISAGNVALAALTTEVNVPLAQIQVVRENREDESQQWIFVEAPRPADCHRPVSDREYFITNVGRARWLDLPRPGNIVIAWYRNDVPTANQAWRVTEFEDGKITLQSVHALRVEGFPNGNQGGPGGHLHIQGGKTVLATEPFFWKIVDTGDKMYKLKPFDAADENVALTTITDSLNDFRNNQAIMKEEVDEDETQYWGFIPVLDGLQ